MTAPFSTSLAKVISRGDASSRSFAARVERWRLPSPGSRQPLAVQQRCCEVKQEAIAPALARRIDPKTLRRHFRRELSIGVAKVNALCSQGIVRGTQNGGAWVPRCPARLRIPGGYFLRRARAGRMILSIWRDVIAWVPLRSDSSPGTLSTSGSGAASFT